MKRYIQILLLVCGCSSLGTVANAVPVVPNFTQGSMQTQTSTQQQVVEIINSVDYRTGWEYTVTGVGVDNNGEPLNPNVNTTTVTINPSVGTGEGAITGAVTSSHDALDFSSQSNFTQTTPGAAFQFTQSYQGPGMTNQTLIQRVTAIQSVTDTTSVFTQ